MDTIQQVVSETFSREADRILATLIGTVRDFELAEDALQDALLVALERWSVEGIPRNPGAWLTTTARHKAIDRLRRENTLTRKQEMRIWKMRRFPTSASSSCSPAAILPWH